MGLQHILLYSLIGLINFALGIFTFSQNRKSSVHRFFAGFCLSVSFWVLSLGLTFSLIDAAPTASFVFVRLAYFFSLMFMVFMSDFLAHFPVPMKRGLLLVRSFGWFSVALALVSLFTPLVHVSQDIVNGSYVGENLGPLYPLYLLTTLAHFGVSFVLITAKWRRLKGLKRRNTMWVGLGLFLFFILGMLTKVILPGMGIWILKEEGVFFSLFFALPSFYAIHHLNLFKFKNNSRNHLQKVMFSMCFFLFVVVVNSLMEGRFSSVLNTVLELLFLISSYHLLQWLIPSISSAEDKDVLNGIDAFKKAMHTYKSTDEIQSGLEKHFILKLHFQDASLHLEAEMPVMDDALLVPVETNGSQIAFLCFKRTKAFSRHLNAAFASLGEWLGNRLGVILAQSQLEEENQIIKAMVVK